MNIAALRHLSKQRFFIKNEGFREFFSSDTWVRLKHLSNLQKGHTSGVACLLLFSAFIQLCAQFIPLLAWFTWPFLVFISVDVLNAQQLTLSSVPRLVLKRICVFKNQPSVVFSLFLYGCTGLLGFRGLTEFMRHLPSLELVFSNQILALLPYTFSEATVLLLMGACSARYTVNLKDPLSVLFKGLLDIVRAPFSYLILVIFQSCLVTPVAIQLAFLFKMPLISIVAGHLPFIVIALLWSYGQNIHLANIKRV